MLMERRGGCHGWARGWRCGEEGLAGGADGEAAAAAIWNGRVAARAGGEGIERSSALLGWNKKVG